MVGKKKHYKGFLQILNEVFNHYAQSFSDVSKKVKSKKYSKTP